MIIGWINLGDSATLTPSSQESALPATNLQNAQLTKKWYTASGISSASVIFDMGSAKSCSLLGVFGTNLTSNANVRLQANTTSSWTSPPFDTTLVNAGVKEFLGNGSLYRPFGAVSYRYWRMILSDATVSQLRIGRVFLGPSWTPSVDKMAGWNVTGVDPSRVTKSYGGQAYVDQRQKYRVLDALLAYMQEDEMYANAFQMAFDRGVANDVLVIPTSGSGYIAEQAVWGRLIVLAPLVHADLNDYSYRMTVEERL